MKNAPIQNRESKVRRALAKLGHRLHKTPGRSWLRSYYDPGYIVTDERNVVTLGCSTREYDATLDEVEAFASSV